MCELSNYFEKLYVLTMYIDVTQFLLFNGVDSLCLNICLIYLYVVNKMIKSAYLTRMSCHCCLSMQLNNKQMSRRHFSNRGDYVIG